MEIFFSHNGMNLEGPFDLEGLKQKKINKNTPIWSEVTSRWTTAEKVKDLQFLFNDTSAETEVHYLSMQNTTVSIQEKANTTLPLLRDLGIIIISIVIGLLI